ncbi:sulfite exporter TauE/SafE family protein [Undibacterium sp. CY18W]|uniref:Sulfite exporter TauE/SafE family protein n=1 Tax=Undibacterium hunanense TaxID=2762292 RepID=A0ABR6ZNP9_9BURK|nr:sulfite exporter TauE/SafE family protein [Undibacterium hunanense]MBC3917510.1 sulfite exporter TauE/SafE family protein [Undibacterium hunanense]
MLTLPMVIAALTAGALGGIHCAGMCGGISMLLTQAGQKRVNHVDKSVSSSVDKGAGKNGGKKIIPIAMAANAGFKSVALTNSHTQSANVQYQMLLHGGRIFTYGLAGAALGGLGAAGLVFKPILPVQQLMFVIGNLALIILGLRLLGLMPHLQFMQQLMGAWQGMLTSITTPLNKAADYPFLMGMGWGCLPCGLLYGVAPFSLLSGDAWSGAVLMLLFGVSALPHLLLTQTLFQRASKTASMRTFRLAGACFLMTVGLLGLWYFDMKSMPAFLCVVPVA